MLVGMVLGIFGVYRMSSEKGILSYWSRIAVQIFRNMRWKIRPSHTCFSYSFLSRDYGKSFEISFSESSPYLILMSEDENVVVLGTKTCP
jgi:hypothetical protein